MAVVVSSSFEDLERGPDHPETPPSPGPPKSNEELVEVVSKDNTEKDDDDAISCASSTTTTNTTTTNTTTTPVCRICLEGDIITSSTGGTGSGSAGSIIIRLVSPCNCAGSVGLMHVPCLEKWLSTTGYSTCELCGYEFDLVRQPRPLSDLLRNKYFVSNVVYFLVMSLVAGVSIWLCLVDTGLYLDHGHYWVVVEWFCIAFVILLFYTVWCKSAFRGQYLIWTDWKGKSQAVKIKGISELAEDNVAPAEEATTGSSQGQASPTKCV